MPIDFYKKLKEAGVAYTFRDFILIPGLSEIEPSQIDLSTNFTKNLRLNIPLVSSPMDTVTEAEMAIALARQGGIGIIHRNMSVEEQVEVVKRVKRAESFIIRDVVTIAPDQNVGDAINLMKKHNISGLPVVDGDKLVGIVTKRDVNFASLDEKISNVMTKDVITADENVTIEEAKRIMHKHRIEKLPVVGKDKRLLGLITIKDIYSREKYSLASRDREGRLLVGAALSPIDINRAKSLDKYVDVLVSDVAHFHNRNILKAAAKLVKEVSADFVIGNIGTSKAMEDAISTIDRIDGVRVGIGSGSSCLTSELMKAGAPTLFAIAQVSVALQKYNLNIPIIADGGIRTPGDAALALAAGASSVMMGNVFAGCAESPGELIKIGGKYYKPYRGMGSLSARMKRYALDRYSHPAKGVVEGVEGVVPYRGDVQTVVEEFVNGLKASFGYVGARNIPELWEKAVFGAVTVAGLEELKPHDIILPGEEKI
ncbi:MAG: IMP dehydrogenase [Nitrososphaerales archaeon]|nr:IMP dehydrogenase [Nitrososphaerales archaeon]